MRACTQFLGLVCLVVLAGCASPDTNIRGRVTYKNQPLVTGVVSLLFADGTLASGQIDPDGNFMIVTTSHGHARVGVWSPKPTSADASLKRDEAPSVGSNPNAAKWFEIPAKYSNPETSGKEVTVGTGRVTIDIALD